VFWSENASFAAEPSVETQKTWDSIMPQGRGFIKHPKLAKDGEVKAIAVFHQIHCLVCFVTVGTFVSMLIELYSTVSEQPFTQTHTSSPNFNTTKLNQDHFPTPALPTAIPNSSLNITPQTTMTVLLSNHSRQTHS
jgi:hypothetical protein